MDTEIWKDIPGFNGMYKASNLGKIKSVNYNHTKSEKVLKINLYKNGYGRICLCKNNTSKTYLVHRLIAITFIPNPENKPQINHKDINKQNNNILNLEWNTYSENNKHSFSSGANKNIGEKHINSKLTKEKVREIRLKYNGRKYGSTRLSKEYNVHQSTIWSIIKNETWNNI
jgi:hypothetical protein